jgi:hypothetical protein
MTPEKRAYETKKNKPHPPTAQMEVEVSEIRAILMDNKSKISIAVRNGINLCIDSMMRIYTEVALEYMEMKGKLSEMTPVLDTIPTQLESLKNALAPDWATVVQRRGGEEVKISKRKVNGSNSKRFSLFVRSAGGDMTPKEIENILKGELNLAPLGISIGGMRSTRRGELVIWSSRREDVDLLSSVINERFGERITAEICKRRKPWVVLKNVAADYDLKRIHEDLTGQNPEIKSILSNTVDFSVKRTIRLKNSSAVHVLVETPTVVRRRLVDMGIIYLGYQRIHIEDSNPLTMCYHCLRAGHTSSKCLNSTKPAKCSHCSGDHRFDACDRKKEVPICINCQYSSGKTGNQVDYNHNALNKEACGYYKRMLNNAKQNIDY